MSNKELCKEVRHEIEILYKSSTVLRLALEYERERYKKKIKKEDVYTKYHEIKTKAKNKWLFRVQKDPLKEKYVGFTDFDVFCFTYYYSSLGLRIVVCSDDQLIKIYTRHLFHRYRERMNLDIPDLLDVVKYYFNHNHFTRLTFLPEIEGISKYYGGVKDGFVMGDYIIEDNLFILKTFISKATSNPKKNAYETAYMTELKEKLLITDKVKDKAEYDVLLFMYKCLVRPEDDELKDVVVKGL
jgi:hypothetical protein